MRKPILKNKLLLILVLLLAFTVSYSSSVFAWDGHGHYRYRDGHWSNNGWFWGFFASGLAVSAIIATLPPRYETVYVSGQPYYYYDNVYYRPCPSGYVVVPAPTTTVVAAPAAPVVVVPAAAPAAVVVPTVMQPRVISGETAVINIPNINGGYTPVTLTKHRTGYIGPQGEYYEGHPSVEQLKVLYGK